ncbi:CbiM family transporter [Fimbriiglobus ruber]|uniref:Substrate-specific component NikM of nickel ECF transporter n=1 Tax=Fimbriiglobus ruber TaxID=1908690 RepID=A0A225E0Y9_9BACT|nr:CbiM family transporter [Fimbriiglobus ruber]OWK47390.1 Substrate-specific component NikM of nickel ECF transporter [Fimbriiglobus ruber]
MLFAVHLSDGILTSVWEIGGWIGTALLLAVACRKVTESEIPRIGVMTAAFFVASQVHLPLGGVSAHLLLNGLVGVILVLRAPLAIAVGLVLQALLFGHGGFYVLGVNVCVSAVPALIAGIAFAPLHRLGLLQRKPVRFAATTAIALVWLATAVVALQWVRSRMQTNSSPFPDDPALWWVADPWVAVSLIVAAAVVGRAERWLEADPEFPIGLLLGAATAYATVGLNCFVLWAGGKQEVRGLAGLVLLAHLPIVALEAIGVGFVVAFLAKAKPEWLGTAKPLLTTSETTSASTD